MPKVETCGLEIDVLLDYKSHKVQVMGFQRSSVSLLPFVQMPCSFKCHARATATFITLRLSESADSI